MLLHVIATFVEFDVLPPSADYQLVCIKYK